jgi:hypothetical protein
MRHSGGNIEDEHDDHEIELVLLLWDLLVDAAGVRKAGESTEDECNDKDDTTIG